MSSRWFRRLAVACSFATTLNLFAPPAHAGPIMDWWNAKHNPPKTCGPACGTPATAYYPWASYYPYAGYSQNTSAYYPVSAGYFPAATAAPVATTANYGVAATSYYPTTAAIAPTAVAPAATTAYYPGATAAVVPAAAPVTAGYAPVTAYPGVTAYSPVVAPTTAYAPVTGAYAPVTAGYAPVGGYVPASVYGYRGATAYRPVIAYRPTTVYQAPAVVNPALVQPGTPYYAVPAGCTAVQRPTTVNFAPNTSYRSAWMPVPVTYYRPVAGIDPTTGQPTTIVQPCTATTWQLQRYPTVLQYPATVGAPVMGGNCATCGPAGCRVPVVGAPAPYYTTPGTAMPTTIGPATTVPGTIPSMTMGPQLPPGTTYPSGTINPGANFQPRFPADSQPSLNPGGVQYGPQMPSNSGGTLNYPPFAGVYNGTAVPVNPGTTVMPNNGGTTTQYPGTLVPNTVVPNTVVPGTVVPGTQYPGAQYPGSVVQPYTPPPYNYTPPPYNPPTTGSTITPPPTTGSASMNSTPSNLVPVTPSNGSRENAKPEMPFKAVPDPDKSELKKEEDVPQLINPHDRSAAIPGRRPLMLAPAKGPEPKSLRVLNAIDVTTQAKPAASDSQTYNDEGWKTMGRK